MNKKLLDIYGKISILLGEVAPTSCEKHLYWIVEYDKNQLMIELSIDTDNIELHIYWLMKADDVAIQIDSHDTIYTIIGYATELGIKTIQG